ncbi:YifB family Mg chelatase-like AAA ATPase [Opitutales bacterium]|nr:YifB family Mg chelatase-like AAA ATPase [Opitutales bacterium]MDA8990315.1 YifB family Mg chelatase-like AAA ATPase [Opitutales bacterium]
MLSTTFSATLSGVSALQVTVESNSGEKGDPKCVLVGLPDASVKESMDRVFSSISNAGFNKPRTHVTINLAPGDLKKEGAAFDLPIALTLLASTGQIQNNRLDQFLIAGELALSGEVRGVKGGLAMAVLARATGKKGILLPKQSALEACLIEGIEIYGIESLAEAVSFFEGDYDKAPLLPIDSPFSKVKKSQSAEDFSDVKGQHALRRAVEISVAGGHNLLVIGPPGAGKSMVAKRIPSVLPKPSMEEFLEILNIYSIQGDSKFILSKGMQRPVRSPHHTISDVGLLGGGTIPGPGEISLAHNGILFLDELPEFKRSALEVLRQPLEDGIVTISRSAGKVTLPCRFMLVAAMNPCPCGFLGDPQNNCRCSIPQIQKYRAKISGPLLDRIDIHVDTPAVKIEELQSRDSGEPSNAIRLRVENCRDFQGERSKRFGINGTTNSNIPQHLMDEICEIGPQEQKLIRNAMKQLSLSARAYNKILKVSRTIADLDESLRIQKKHLLEAIQYRSLDRNI